MTYDNVLRWPRDGREYSWTAPALADTKRYGLPWAEVVDALYAPPGLRYEHIVGDDLVVVAGMSGSGLVIISMCERVERTTTLRILRVKPAMGRELDEWRRRVR